LFHQINQNQSQTVILAKSSMTIQKFIKYTPLDLTGKPLDSTQELTLNVLEKSGNYLLHKDLLRHYNSQRQGTVSTKTRSEVRGGGRKPWQQKGTGRARAGSNTSPLWKGGGVTFGPKPKTISLKLNKKERKLALQTLLYNKKNNILVIENLENGVTDSKTKSFLSICTSCSINLNQPVLVVVGEKTLPLKLATQNIKNVELILASNLNTFSLLKAKQILVTPLALNTIKEIYCD
jgi:large subunit ribosomal protein L4